MKELIKIQNALCVPKDRKDAQGKYNYRSMEDILSAVKKLMSEDFMLLMSDEVVNIGARNYVKASVRLTNGEESVSNEGYAWEPDKIASMSGPQITGSCSSYARKLALCGLFMIDDSKDVDSLSDLEKGSGSGVKMATDEQMEEMKGLVVALETIDPGKSDYIDKQIQNPSLEYAKAAEIIRRSK
jgi:hypothetical protein